MSTLAYKSEEARAVDSLLGLQLKDGWVVSEKLVRGAKQSGGNFSVGYIAKRGSEQAFMKAFDFEKAFDSDDPMKELELLAKSYNFEKELLKLCEQFKMSKVVRAVADGVVDHADAPMGKIYYLLFELADGDIRADFEFTATKTMVWRLKCLHEVAVALQQLHRREFTIRTSSRLTCLCLEKVRNQNLQIWAGPIALEKMRRTTRKKLPERTAMRLRSFCMARRWKIESCRKRVEICIFLGV